MTTKSYTIVYVQGGPRQGFYVQTPRGEVEDLVYDISRDPDFDFIYLTYHDDRQVAIRPSAVVAIDTYELEVPEA